jgi:SAM-dependent methyltransferase
MRKKCLICGREEIVDIFCAKDQPLSRYGLVEFKQSETRKFPIRIARCQNCTHIQNIAYKEGTIDYTHQEIKESRIYSREMRLLLEKQAAYLKSFHKKEGGKSTILEIGCGDGYFASLFGDFSEVVGFEPSPEGKMARDRGVNIIDRYFSLEDLKDFECFDIIVMRQVLEHIDRPVKMISEIKQKLFKGGLLYLEVPNGSKSLSKKRFHDFYYEHVSHFTKASMVLLLEGQGFEVLSCRSDHNNEIITVVAEYLGEERLTGQCLSEEYQCILRQIQLWIDEKKTIVGWGTAGNGSLFFSLLNITDDIVKYVVDSDKRKQGLFLPVTNQKVISPAELIKINPDVVIVLSQFHSDEIKREARKLIGNKIIINFFD